MSVRKIGRPGRFWIGDTEVEIVATTESEIVVRSGEGIISRFGLLESKADQGDRGTALGPSPF